jgi:organic hydroperoxide reductase OsmC/OhrA
MGSYEASIHWQRGAATFTDNRYSRAHTWRFDGGLMVPASSSPQVLPVPLSVAENVDPEEAFVAALSSCHMLFYLSIAAKRGYVIDDYQDRAIGWLEKNENGDLAMTRVSLRPQVTYHGEQQPSQDLERVMHEEAHRRCFLANSVTTLVDVQI